ncbi:MAG: SCO family protein [Acidimicrobiales bacterium]|nr:SCO family protein [Acidimicrobiales bacterium]HRW39352.1 SCO family protein [Aquihabitans sp.]
MASPPDRPRRAHRALALLVAGSIGLLAACGSDAGSDAGGTTQAAAPTGDFRDEVQGLQRDDPIEVGDVVVPEVAADGSTTPFALKAEPGDLLFVAFGYTNCPDVCPTTLTDIRKAKALLDADESARVAVAFGTVDPERDTADVMSAYLGSFVEGGHALRTEDPAELKAAEDALGITSQVVKDPDGTVEVAHSAKSFVIDDQGRVVDEWAFGSGPELMASDLRLLLEG